MSLVERSAGPAYRRATGLSDAERRVVHQVGVHAPLSVTQITALLRQDKAQVSRAVGRLLRRGLLTRHGLRAPLELTGQGRATFAQIVRLAHERNATLIGELTDAEASKLPALLARLQSAARKLIPVSARDASRSHERIAARLTDRQDVRLRQRDLGPRERLVLPDIINLLNLLRSSAGPAFGKATGLSTFHGRIVSAIGEYPSLTLIELVPTINRDKSQVSRAVKHLVAAGLITTEKIGGGRHVRLATTAKGQRICDRVAELAVRRDTQLLAYLQPAERRLLALILDRLTSGAKALLSGEPLRTRIPVVR